MYIYQLLMFPHFTQLDLITVIIFCEEHELWTSS